MGAQTLALKRLFFSARNVRQDLAKPRHSRNELFDLRIVLILNALIIAKVCH